MRIPGRCLTKFPDPTAQGGIPSRPSLEQGREQERGQMLTKEKTERLTRVGAGTPMGELLRRYWHPIAAAGELDKKPTKEVTVLGEELVLYKDRSGTLGLIGRRCPHRRVSLVYGVPEADGLRCQYPGWQF